MRSGNSTRMCMYTFVHIGRKREYERKLLPTLIYRKQIQEVNSYFIASHQPQISQGFAALCNEGGSLICNFFTPSDIHSLYGHAIPADGYQRCKAGERERKQA